MKWEELTIPGGNFFVLGPVLSLIITGVLEIVIGMFWKKTTLRTMSYLSILGTFTAIIFYLSDIYFGQKCDEVFGYLIIKDGLTSALQPLILITVFVLLFFSEPFLKKQKLLFNEFYPLLLWSASGALLLISTTNWLMIFIALELFSLSLYILCGLNIHKKKSQESALKYFLLGTFASAFILYGIALLYGATGSLRMETIIAAWSLNSLVDQTLLIVGHLMVLIGFLFKLGIVPFHFWSPDVYQGAPTIVTAYMAIIGKVISLGVLVRILEFTLPLRAYFMPLMIFLTLLTIFVSNIMALRQVSFKRLLAFSSISHSGYLMVGLLSAYSLYDSLKGSFFPDISLTYLYVYSTATLGIFLILMIFTQGEEEDIFVQQIKSIWNFSPLLGFSLIGFILSIAGIPPFIGFFAKTSLFMLCFESKQYLLMGGLIIGSLIGVSYYLKIAGLSFSNLKSFQYQEKQTITIHILIIALFMGSLLASPFIFPMFFK